MRRQSRMTTGFRGQIMKRVFVVCFTAILMTVIVGLAPARAASHSGPESLAKGNGAVSSTDTQTEHDHEADLRPLQLFRAVYPVATQVTVTETEESFDFSAKLGPKTSTRIPPTVRSGR